MTVRNTKTEIKVKSLEKSVPKEVALNHTKAVYGFISNSKLDSKLQLNNK